MAKTSLRAYTHEIEEMIEHNQFDQAIAHCRNILKYYPKHINTYRLLGKAFLENQRYGDAGDIFQRILSSFPEDFISHVGMSIIREDEGNLDDSLWHMERAFEIQPSNNAIQGELRRLHGKLEGTEPAKVRLTRGALAHMYIRGDLLSQAIAELRIALTEDPSRFDLQTVLAKAYHQSGQLAEAAKISNGIIGKLPYSFEANRVLTDIYKKSDRLQEAETYQQRLFELDPYFAHVSDKILTPEQVDDMAVSVERLDWKPGFTSPGVTAQPEWAKSIGVSMDSPTAPKENVPDWFSSAEETPIKTGQQISPIIDISEEEGQLPSTWEAPEPVADLTPPTWRAPEPVADQFPSTWQAPEPNADQIRPDWESPIEPVQMADDSFLQSTESIQEDQQIFSEETITSEESLGAEAEELALADIPDWLKALKPQTGSLEGKLPEKTAAPSEPQVEKEYSWLEETPTGQAEKWSQATEEKEEIEAELPLAIPGEDNIQIPDWLQGGEEPVAPEAEAPRPIQGLGQFTSEPVDKFAAETFTEEFKEEKDDFSWLSEGRSEQIPEETSQKESSVWLGKAEEEPMPVMSADEGLPPAVEVELPEWLAQMKQEAEQHPELIKPVENIPDWVKNIEEPPISEEDTKPTRLSQQLAAQESSSFPGEQIPQAAIFGTPEIKSYEEKPLASTFEDKDFDFKDDEQEISPDSFTKAVEEEGQIGWLTEMEAQQQYEQGIFQEEKSETPPDWVSESLHETELPSAVQEEPTALEEVELPDWLAEVAPKTEEQIETGAEARPEWLNEYESQPSQPEEAGEPIPSDSAIFTVPETLIEVTAPEEIEAFPSKGFAEPGIFEEAEKTKEEEALPEWLLEYKEESPVEVAAEPLSEPQPLTEVPAWFEQPEQIANLDIAFDEVPSTKEPFTVEEQLPIEEISPLSVEIEPAIDLEAQEEIPVFEAPAEEAHFAETIISEAPAEEIPFTEALVETLPFAEELVSNAPIEEFPFEEAPVLKAPMEELLFAETLVPETPAEIFYVKETPVTEIPTEELPIEESPAEEIPIEELPVEEAPVADISEEELPVEEAPVAEIPAEEMPVEEAPVAEIPAEELPVEEAPVSETPVEEISVEEIPVSEAPMEELPVEEAPVSETPGEELPIEEEPVKKKPIKKAPVTRLLVEEIPVEEAPIEMPITLIDLNQASLVELERLAGVGFIKAQGIINFRNDRGAFASVDELVEVPGFDDALVDSLKSKLGVVAPIEQPVQAVAEAEIHTPLLKARTDLQQGRIPEAVSQYIELIENNADLEDIAYDLQVAIDQYPTDTDLWQTLGDTCVRLGKLQDALNAYTQAEKLLR